MAVTDAYRITGFPRLHLGLIDLSGVTRRAYGGAGMAVAGLPTVVTVRRAASTEIHPPGLPAAARSAIGKALAAAAAAGWDTRVLVDVHRAPPAHVGLGSTTTAVLCTLRGVAAVHGHLPCDADLQRLSGRGRTSGVGVNTFFTGGLVVDVGRPQITDTGLPRVADVGRPRVADTGRPRIADTGRPRVAEAGRPRENGRGGYLPSSANPGTSPSRKLLSLPMPVSWQVSLLLYDSAPTVHGTAEVEFFRRHAPVAPRDSLMMMAELYHGVLPAILETDLGLLSAALRAYQGYGFKRAEIAGQPAPVRDLLAELHHDTRIACGLSSMGPALFAIHEKGEFEPAAELTKNFTVFGPFPFRNEAYECIPSG